MVSRYLFCDLDHLWNRSLWGHLCVTNTFCFFFVALLDVTVNSKSERGCIYKSRFFLVDVTVISKYCIQYMNYKRPEGCYSMSADQGYIKRCYCYSHWCNTANKNSSRTLAVVVQALFALAVLNWIIGT